MINNAAHRGLRLPLLLLLSLACRRPDTPAGLQGVVEYDERGLAFEVSGRVVEIAVKVGDTVAAGALIARLDDSLAKTAFSARHNEARSAADQLALLRAGARGEDVRALRARIDAAAANEALLERSATRMRNLTNSGATTQAALDEAQAHLVRAQAERRALQENLGAMSSGARRQEIMAAEHRVAAAEAGAQLEKERLERHELRAQTAAEVLEVHLEPSEMAPAGVPVATLGDVTHPFAEIFVPQAGISAVHPGDRARARVDGVAQDFTGTVELVHRRTEFTPRYLFSESERANLVVRVRVRLHDTQRRLHAGVPIFVKLEGGTP